MLNVNKDAKERIGHLLRLEGKKQSQVPKLTTGEIGAVAKLKDTEAGDTLADEKAPIRYPGLVPFSAAISFAIEPKAKGDEEKAMQGLHRLMEEDPTLRMQRDAQTKEIILSGVGQLHIEVTVEKLKRKFGVEVELKAPKVPYKETIKGSAKAQGRLKKQTGGRGQFGDCLARGLAVAARQRASSSSTTSSAASSRASSSRRSRRACARRCTRASSPATRSSTCGCGSTTARSTASTPRKWRSRSPPRWASRPRSRNAKPILLEPIMVLEIAVPDDCMGDVIGDLNSRRGKVLGVDPKVGSQVIRALVPMAEVLRYSPDLRSMTSGRGAFTMEFAHYEELPAHLAEKVVKEARGAEGRAQALMGRSEDLAAHRRGDPSRAATRRGARGAGRGMPCEPPADEEPAGADPRSAPPSAQAGAEGQPRRAHPALRDANRMVQRFVLQNPRISDEEIIALAKNRSIDRELLDLICSARSGSNYRALALATNPKTPLTWRCASCRPCCRATCARWRRAGTFRRR